MLEDQISHFIDYKVSRGATKATEVTYRSILSDFLLCLGNIPTSTITLQMIDTYDRAIYSRGYKPKTLHCKLATVRAFIRYLYARDLTHIKPESIELPKVIDTESNFLTPEEQAALLFSIPNKRDRAIIHTMLSSGLRVSELLALRYDDLYENSIVVRCGKGKKPRVTFITDECRADIAVYRRSKRRSDYLFTNNAGLPISRQYIARIVSEYASAARIPKHVSPHTLRHSFATNLLRNGARVEVAQKLMGHANIQTTLIYMHFTNPYLQSEYNKFSTGLQKDTAKAIDDK